MAKIWSIRGVPLKIQTKTFEVYDKGLNFDIVQNDIRSPRGSAKTSVSRKSMNDVTNPWDRLVITVKNSCI